MSKPKSRKPISRRQFIEGTGAALVAATAVPALYAQTPAAKPALADGRSTVHLTINGAPHTLEVDDR